jgi:hypothetical protein
MIDRSLYISVLRLLFLKLDVAEKGTLGPVGEKKFRVELVPLFHQDEGKRRDGLVENRGNCEPVAPFVTSTIVQVVVVVLTQASLATLFVTLLSRRWNNASDNPTSTKKYKNFMAEGLVFLCDTGTLLIYVG